MRAALRQLHLEARIPAAIWQQAWVVDCRPVGNGLSALKYRAPYIFRVARSNNRSICVEHDQVTFRYPVGKSGQTASCTLPVQEFLRRFLQHSLPKGFVKVRYYGLFRVGMRRSLARLRSQLQLMAHSGSLAPRAAGTRERGAQVQICLRCGQPMRVERILRPHNRGPPSRADDVLKQQLRTRWGRVARLPIRMHDWVCPEAGLMTTRTYNAGVAPPDARTAARDAAPAQHPWAACVQACEPTKQHRPSFERSLLHATPR